MAEPPPSPPRPPNRPFLPLLRPRNNLIPAPGLRQQAFYRSPYSTHNSTRPRIANRASGPSTQPLYRPVSVPPSSSTQQHHATNFGLGLSQQPRSLPYSNITGNTQSHTTLHNPFTLPTTQFRSFFPGPSQQTVLTPLPVHDANYTNEPRRPSNAPFTVPPQSRVRHPGLNRQAPAQQVPRYAAAFANGLQSSLGFAVEDPSAFPPQAPAPRGVRNNDANASSSTYPPPLNNALGLNRQASVSQASSFSISSTVPNPGSSNTVAGPSAQLHPFRQVHPRASGQAVPYAAGFPNRPQHPQGSSIAGPSTQAPLPRYGLGLSTQAPPYTAAFPNRPQHPPRNAPPLPSGRLRRPAHPPRNAISVQNQQTAAPHTAHFSNAPYSAHFTNTHTALPSRPTIRAPRAPLPDPRQTDTPYPQRFLPQGSALSSPRPLNRPARPPRNFRPGSSEQSAPYAPYSAHFATRQAPRSIPTIISPSGPPLDEARQTNTTYPHGLGRPSSSVTTGSNPLRAPSNRQSLSQPPVQNPMPQPCSNFRYYVPNTNVAPQERGNAVARPSRFVERPQSASDGVPSTARQSLQPRETFPPERRNRNAMADPNTYFQWLNGPQGTEQEEVEIYDDEAQEMPPRKRHKGKKKRTTPSIYSLYITPVVNEDRVLELYNKCYEAIEKMDKSDGAILSEAEGLIGFVFRLTDGVQCPIVPDLKEWGYDEKGGRAVEIIDANRMMNGAGIVVLKAV